MTRVGMSRGASNSVTVIEPETGWRALGVAELWRARQLLQMFIERDIRLRYKQTVLGIIWSVLQPLVAMVVFTIVLNGAVGVRATPGVPYPIYTYAGLIIWLYFAEAITRASRSLVANNLLLSKVYFPRLVLPLAGVTAPLVDFGAAAAVLIGMMVFYHVPIMPSALVAIPLVAATMLCATAFGVWFAALNVQYRDVGYVVPIAVQLWLFLTPVVYSVQNVHGVLRVIFSLNPMAGIVMAFRWAILGKGNVDVGVLLSSLCVLVVVLLAGVLYFRRVERTFADVI